MDYYEAGIFLTRSSIFQPISEWLLFILHVGYIQFVIILSKYFNILKYDWQLVLIFYSHYAHYNKREDYQYVITALTARYISDIKYFLNIVCFCNDLTMYIYLYGPQWWDRYFICYGGSRLPSDLVLLRVTPAGLVASPAVTRKSSQSLC